MWLDMTFVLMTFKSYRRHRYSKGVIFRQQDGSFYPGYQQGQPIKYLSLSALFVKSLKLRNPAYRKANSLKYCPYIEGNSLL